MAIDKRKIPKSDRAKRSLYMSPTYMKNLKGKNKRIEWEGEKTKSGSGDDYTFVKTKKGATKGTSKHAIRTPYGDDVEKVEDKHMTFKKKGGGSDTIRRHKKIKGSSQLNPTGEFDEKYDIRDTGTYLETQDKKGKVTSQIQLKEPKEKKKKTVKQKTTTYQGKKGDTINPKVKDSTFTGMVAPKKYRKLYKEKAKKWKEGKAKRENDNKVQTDIKNGFGDMLSSSNFEKRKKEQESSFAKKKKQQESSFEKKKREMEASFEKKRKSMGG